MSLLPVAPPGRRLDEVRADLVKFPRAVVELRRLEEAVVEVVLRVEKEALGRVSELPLRLALLRRLEEALAVRFFCWVRRRLDVTLPLLPLAWRKDEACGVRLDERRERVPTAAGEVLRFDGWVRK